MDRPDENGERSQPLNEAARDFVAAVARELRVDRAVAWAARKLRW